MAPTHCQEHTRLLLCHLVGAALQQNAPVCTTHGPQHPLSSCELLLPHPAGCPANVVTGGGAGSSLLRDPQQLQQVVSALVAAVGERVPVSVKMRSGFADTSLFLDNLLAVQEAGASFVTLHPRTKAQAYAGRADWGLIATAKELLGIPVVS